VNCGACATRVEATHSDSGNRGFYICDMHSWSEDTPISTTSCEVHHNHAGEKTDGNLYDNNAMQRV
jgi:hypothetical protein